MKVLKNYAYNLHSDSNRLSNYHLRVIILHFDKLECVKTDDLIEIELLFHSIFENSDNIRLRQAVLSDPELMMQFISQVYFPNNEEAREEEIKAREASPNCQAMAQLCGDFLHNLKGVPCVGDNNEIKVDDLNKYVDTLITLGEDADRVAVTKITVGELLAYYPETASCPPKE